MIYLKTTSVSVSPNQEPSVAESRYFRVVNFVLPVLCLFVCSYCRIAVAAAEKEKPAAKGLVGRWRFDEASWTGAKKEVKDSSGKGNHASARGGCKTGDGISGRCGKFDGNNDYIELANTSDLNPSRITVMCWFNAARGTLEDQKFIVLKSHLSHTDPYYQYGLGLMHRAGASKSAYFILAVNGKYHGCTMRNSPYEYDKWHHLAGTFDGKTMKLYLDGRQVASKPAPGKISSYNSPLLIGACGNLGKSEKYCFKGKLDEIAVYNRALTTKEILMQYRAASGESVISYPGMGKVFNKVCGDHFAAESFTAINTSLTSASVWLAEANDDEVLVQVLEGSIKGKVLASAALSAGKTGKRTVYFTSPAVLKKGQVYYLKVLSGAPGTTTGSVELQTKNATWQGFTEKGKTDLDMAMELVFRKYDPAAARKAAATRIKTEEDIRYEKAMNEALTHKTDVWGDALIAKPEGPTYGNIVKYMRPIMYCGDYVTTTGVYYLVFGKPAKSTGGSDCALHVADGSEIITRQFKTGRRTTFFVGKEGDELFGSNIEQLKEPKLHDGYQPILISGYTDKQGVSYRQESFATYVSQTKSLVSFIRLAAQAKKDGKILFRVKVAKRGLTVEGNRLVKDGKTYIVFQPGASYAEPYLTYSMKLSKGSQTVVHVARLNQPKECKDITLGEKLFTHEHKKVCEYWDNCLSKGARFEVPEKLAMDAMQNLLIQNIFMGWRYSIGNAYERYYPNESGNPVTILAEYGFRKICRDNMQYILPRMYHRKNQRFYDEGEKMLLAARYYLLTGDRAFIEKNEKLYTSFMTGTLAARKKDANGLMHKCTYSGDIPTQGYSLHHQVRTWRGIRDMAMVYGLLGMKEKSHKFSEGASEYKAALLKAINASKVDMKDGSLFIPTVLLESRKPYSPITKTKIGSYWNLVSNYGLSSGIIPMRGKDMGRILHYMFNHGSRFLGLTRFNYYPVPIGSCRQRGLPGYKTTGADNVYGVMVIDMLAAQDEADQIVLSFYGKLAHGMTRGTFISGEGDSFEPGKQYRSMYLPPNLTNNALFLKILHDMLIYNHMDEKGMPAELLLAHFTPRAWLEDGKEIKVARAATMFGEISYHIKSHLKQNRIEVQIQSPARSRPESFILRLRTPLKRKIKTVTINGKSGDKFNPEKETIDLSGISGKIKLEVRYGK